MNIFTKITNTIREYVTALDESMPQLTAPAENGAFVEDIHNNVGRRCSVRGDHSGRNWRIENALTGDRYMVHNAQTHESRIVNHRDLSNLY